MKKRKHPIQRRAYRATRSFLRGLRRNKNKPAENNSNNKNQGIRVAFIYNEREPVTGADHINQLMARALKNKGVHVRGFYPRGKLMDTPTHLRGLSNILFFHSLLEHRDQVLKHHIIQGTTYTALPFLTFNIPVISHFGSTAIGFLDETPRTKDMKDGEQRFWKMLHRLGIIPELDFKTNRPLQDIADMEILVATRATACIATSAKVKKELVHAGVPEKRVRVIHNAIEDYWFDTPEPPIPQEPQLVFLGRLGGDAFTLKLKGLDRLFELYNAFPDTPKTTIFMTANKRLKEWLRVAFPKHYMFVNLRKDFIPKVLHSLFGSIVFIPSRYEGFSLSLVEAMSQGLVPISYSVGVAPEIIKNGENGYIVSSIEEAQERVRELLFDKEKRITMAHAARASTEQFRSTRIAADLLGVYLDIRTEKRNSYDSGEKK